MERQKKFQKAVDKEAKKIVASAMEAEDADDEAFTAKLNAAIKKRSKANSEISATAVINKKKEDLSEMEETEYQKCVKLSGIVKLLSKNGSTGSKKKYVTM